LAGDLAVGPGAEVGIVSVIPVGLGPPADDPWSARSAHAAELHAAEEALRARGLRTTTHAPTGDAGPMIVRVAREFGYDLIVVGSRQLDPLRRAVLGSVSTYVVRHADASVLIAR
jgi:nucleotide-binding universal stress UspA family protein